MTEPNSSIESIVVIPDSLINDSQSHRAEINCINESDLTSSQMTLRNHMDDTSSSSFMTAIQDPEHQRMEREIINLRALLNAYKNENTELRLKLQKQTKRDVFCDVDSAFLIEKIENNLQEANKIFDSNSKLKDSIEYLIKNLWSSIAFNYDERKLLTMSRTRDELMHKLETACQKSEESFDLSETVKCLQSNNLKLKAKIAEQNKLFNNLIDLYEKSRVVSAETVQEVCEEETLTNQEDPVYYLYHMNDMKGYIAIDQDLSLNKELQAKPVNGLYNTDQSKLLKCPKCFITVNVDSIGHDMYQAHVENCDSESNYMCMFCLCQFDKSCQNEYLNHIDVHLGQLGNECNN